MNRRLVITVGATVLTALSLVHAQPADRAEAALVAEEQAPPANQMPSQAGMTKMHEQMMAELKAADTRLEQLVADMNLATGDAKVAALAQVVTELVKQQKATHAHMTTMCAQMGHQMGHHAPPKQ